MSVSKCTAALPMKRAFKTTHLIKENLARYSVDH